MEIKLRSSNYDIIDHGIIILYQEDSDLTFDIDTGTGFKFKLVMKFINDANSEKCVNRIALNDVVTLECINFLPSGTGTSIPIEVAQVQNKKMCMAFWVYTEGDVVGQKKTKSVKYTLFMER